MSLVRFLVFQDDDNKLVLTSERLQKYDITLIPCSYYYGNRLYVSGVNSNVKYYSFLLKNNCDVKPDISADLIRYLYESSKKSGYMTVFVLCPHSKFADCYKTAMLAKKKFMRNEKSEDRLNIKVIDTKSLGIDFSLASLQMICSYYNYSNSVFMAEQAIKARRESAKTYILSYSDIPFSGNKSTLSAYVITGSRIKSLNITQSVESVQFDRFADIIIAAFDKTHKYAVSYGSDCNFVGNILGRIEAKLKFCPITIAIYGILTTNILGPASLCIHVL